MKKISGLIFNIFCWLSFLGVGALWGLQGWFFDWRGIIGVIAVVVIIVLVMDVVNKRFWPKAESEDKKPVIKEPWVKVIFRMVLQVTMGGAFGFGLIGIIFALIDGNTGGFGYYIGCIVVSVIILLILLFVKPLQDQQVKNELAKAKKELKTYGKDERLVVIAHKAVYVTFGVTLMLLLIFGAFIAITPPDNYNIITMGILGIVGFSMLLYTILYALYDAEKLDVTKRKSVAMKGMIFIASVIPIILLGGIWIVNGLPSVGIAYLVAFVIVSVYTLVELWYACRYK